MRVGSFRDVVYIWGMNDFDLIVVGGGAAGFFGSIQAAEMQPGLKILIVEKTNKLLSKVRVSGGGRCNCRRYSGNTMRETS
jgi:predicted flavoprotein YhiN